MKFPDAPGSAMRLVVTLYILAVVLWGCAGSAPRVQSPQRGMPEDIGGVLEEKAFRESELVLPTHPENSALIEFQLRRNTANRFYIDRNSISIGPDRVVRYSALIKSPSGVLNTSYEGMRCKTSEYKVYAYGIKNGDWTNARDSQWRWIERSSANFRFTLYKDYFCHSEAIAGRNEQDLIANLKGNPLDSASDRNR